MPSNFEVVKNKIAKHVERGDVLRKPKEAIAALQKDDFQYSTLSRPSNIRLLRIEPGMPTDVVSCSLRQVDLDDKPRYTALSYTWKRDATRIDYMIANAVDAVQQLIKKESFRWVDPDPKQSIRTILCNGCPVSVGPNLYIALLQLRQMPPDEYWTDALCINQRYVDGSLPIALHILPAAVAKDISTHHMPLSIYVSDLDERSSQVQMMDRIYSDARMALVWLGDCPAAGRSIESVSRSLEYLVQNPEHVRRYFQLLAEGNGQQMVKHPIYSKINEAVGLASVISRNNWFKRIWVLQEYLLAPQVVFLLGNHQINPHLIEAALDTMQAIGDTQEGSQLLRFMRSVLSHRWDNLGVIPQFLRARSKFVKPEQQLNDTDGAVCETWQPERWTVGEWLEACRGRAASDPRDMVFAGLGLIQDESLLIYHNIQLPPPLPRRPQALINSTEDEPPALPPRVHSISCSSPINQTKSLWHKLHADCNASETEVLVNLAACVLSQQDEHSGRLLSMAVRPLGKLDNVFMDFMRGVGYSAPTHLPSWAPCPASSESSLCGVLPWRNNTTPWGFASGLPTSILGSETGSHHMTISHDSTTLFCESVILDSVDQIFWIQDLDKDAPRCKNLCRLLRVLNRLPVQYPAAARFSDQTISMTGLEALACALFASFGKIQGPLTDTGSASVWFCNKLTQLVRDHLGKPGMLEYAIAKVQRQQPGSKKGESKKDIEERANRLKRLETLAELKAYWDQIRYVKYASLPFWPAEQDTPTSRRDEGQGISDLDELQEMEELFTSQRVFVTSTGLLGAGPSWLRRGDAVMLVRGTFVPYLFRGAGMGEKENNNRRTGGNDTCRNKQKGDKNGEPWEIRDQREMQDSREAFKKSLEAQMAPGGGWVLVGEAYLTGYMYGEALERGVRFERMKIV